MVTPSTPIGFRLGSGARPRRPKGRVRAPRPSSEPTPWLYAGAYLMLIAATGTYAATTSAAALDADTTNYSASELHGDLRSTTHQRMLQPQHVHSVNTPPPGFLGRHGPPEPTIYTVHTARPLSTTIHYLGWCVWAGWTALFFSLVMHMYNSAQAPGTTDRGPSWDPAGNVPFRTLHGNSHHGSTSPVHA